MSLLLPPTPVNQRQITLVRLPKRNIHLDTRITPRRAQVRIPPNRRQVTDTDHPAHIGLMARPMKRQGMPLHTPRLYLDLHLDHRLDLLIPASPARILLSMEGTTTMDTRPDTSRGMTTSQRVTTNAVKIFTTTAIIIIITMKAVDILLEAFLNLFQEDLCLRHRSASQTRNHTKDKLHRNLDSRTCRSQTILINMDGAIEAP
jgi:hypothetical protein